MTSSPSPGPPTPTTASSSPSPPPTISVSPPPTPTLLAYESLRFSHSVLYNKTACLAFLTSHRILVLSLSSSATLFQIPTSIVSGHNISAATSPQCLLRILYIPPPSATIPPTPASDVSAAKAVILQFTSGTATLDRQQWKEAVAAIQTRNQAKAQVEPAAEETSALPPPNPTVKLEPAESPTPSPPLAPPASTARSASPSPPPSVTTISLATLEVRAALLARHAHLKQLHSDLVGKGILSEEEFWQSPSHAELVRRETEASSHQQRGLSSAMAADILPDVRSTSVHFKIDANIMHAIFLHSPAVHRAYGQLVPTQMSEKEFWTKYFKSRYVHAGRAALLTGDDRSKGGAAAVEAADAFTRTIDDAEKKVEEEEGRRYGEGDRRVKALIQQKHVDPSVDLTSADADEAVTAGQPSILNHDHSNSEPSLHRASKKSRAQAELVKKFNRHGMLVLDSSHAPPGAGQGAVGGQTVKEEEDTYHRELNASLTLKDLQQETGVYYDVLPLQRRGGFFVEGQGKGKAASSVEEDERRRQGVKDFLGEVDGWTADRVVHALPAPSQALALLQSVSLTSRAMNRAAFLTQQIHAKQSTLSLDAEVAPTSSGGAGTAAAEGQPLVFSTVDGSDTVVPVEFQVHLKKHFLTLQELLRHFYGCFPVTAKMQGKLQRIKLAVDAAYKGLLLLQADLNTQGQTALTPILRPLTDAIENCHALYQKWTTDQEKLKRHVQRQQNNNSPTHAQQQQAPKKIKVG